MVFNLTSDNLKSETNSEAKKEGIKYITESVLSFLREKKTATYQEIVVAIDARNNNTKIRRIYDVLNVLRAVNVIGKHDKSYYMISASIDLTKKKQEMEKLRDMRDAFVYIIDRNRLKHSPQSQRLYLPFMVVYTEKQSEIHCYTDGSREYFNFTSDRPLRTICDLDIINKIKEQKDKQIESSNKI
ncbi:TFDP [Hepatospora eriocheir]|uniref:TFDP n=1 Tax=Hepatospora eriocheir TaxID=1081669 RepID=A0A1X0QE79_9MICR|nr:TFDP [Hepatospora eriocheir]